MFITQAVWTFKTRGNRHVKPIPLEKENSEKPNIVPPPDTILSMSGPVNISSF